MCVSAHSTACGIISILPYSAGEHQAAIAARLASHMPFYSSLTLRANIGGIAPTWCCMYSPEDSPPWTGAKRPTASLAFSPMQASRHIALHDGGELRLAPSCDVDATRSPTRDLVHHDLSSCLHCPGCEISSQWFALDPSFQELATAMPEYHCVQLRRH